MRNVSKLIGQRFGYLRRGLLPNNSVSLDLTLTDTVGEKFFNQCEKYQL